jgi:hypothetical protein
MTIKDKLFFRFVGSTNSRTAPSQSGGSSCLSLDAAGRYQSQRLSKAIFRLFFSKLQMCYIFPEH